MENKARSTEWALLFPLKAGLFAMKTSISSGSVSREKEKISREGYVQSRVRIRRGSSLSDLGKLIQTHLTLPDVVRSTEKGSESLPHSPALSRTNLQLGSTQVRGSIGDLMNLKKYGGSTWSVRSETLIAKVVPLSTVTPKQCSPEEKADEDVLEDFVEYQRGRGQLTCAQRIVRLSKLIKKQRRQSKVLSPHALLKEIKESAQGVSFFLCFRSGAFEKGIHFMKVCYEHLNFWSGLKETFYIKCTDPRLPLRSKQNIKFKTKKTNNRKAIYYMN